MENFSASTMPAMSQFAMPGVALRASRTGVSVAYRNRTVVAPMAAVEGIALLSISDAVEPLSISDVAETTVFGTRAGIRSWDPPV